MALDRRIVSINFTQGVDFKTDKKLTTKLTQAENCVLRKNGTIEKRLGFVADGTWSYTGAFGGTANPIRVFPFNGDEFVISDFNDSTTDYPQGIPGQHVLSKVSTSWRSKGLYTPVTVKTKTLHSDTYSVSAIDAKFINRSATQTGVIVARVHTGASNGANYSTVFDPDSGNKLPVNQGSFPLSRVVSITSSDTKWYDLSLQLSGTVLSIVERNTNNSQNFNNNSISGVASANPQFDAVSFNNKIYFAFKQVSTTGIVLGWFDPSNSTTSLTVIPASTTCDMLTIATPQAGTDRLRLFWMKNNPSNTALHASYSATLTEILAPTTITIGVPGYGDGLITQIGACENSGATSVALYFTQSSTTGLGPYSSWNCDYGNTANQVNFTQSASLNGMKLCTLVAKPFVAHGKRMAIFSNTSTGQQSYVLVQSDLIDATYAIARWGYGLAGGNASASYHWLPEVAQGDADTFAVGLRQASFFGSANGSITVTYDAELAMINFSNTQPIQFCEVAEATYLGGGFISEYDGLDIVELGFLSFPSVTVSVTTSGGSLTSGVYSVVVVKEFIDQKGRVHQGTPSIPYTFTTSTTTSAATIIVSDGPNFKGSVGGSFPNASTRGLQINYSIYRTQGNGSIYYKDSSIGINAFSFGVTSSTKSVTISDSSLSGGTVVYTQGGRLPNFTPDSSNCLWLHGNRIFCSDPTDDSIVRFSNELVEGEGPAFAVSNIIRIPGVGDITAGISLDSNCIVFRNRSIYAVTGDGPDDTGQNGSFSDGQLLYADIGCINSRNLCRFRDGIVFKSPDKGFYLLTRDLQLQYVGQDVERFNLKTVVSSEVVAIAEADPTTGISSGVAEECRFLCSDGRLITYNYYNGQWTNATLSGCTDAIYSGGKYFVTNPSTTASSARVFQQSTSTYTDDFLGPGSVTYQMRVETGWIKTADIQGFQRVYKVGILGEAQGPGKFTVDVGYDYENDYTETHTATMSSLTAANYVGGNESAPQADFTPTRPKCQAIRFRIIDIPDPGGGAVIKLTNISLECGLKKGKFLLPASKGI